MFIVCTGKEADKKIFKKTVKVIVSQTYEDVDASKPTLVTLNQLLPPMQLFYEFLDGTLSQKKYCKKYCEYIRKHKQCYASIVLLMMGYKESKDICLVCSPEEMKYGYMNGIAKILREDFGAEVLSYKKWKEKGKKFGKCKLDMNALKKAVKKYRAVLEDTDKPSKKKSKKNKKKDKKKKSKKSKVKFIKDVIEIDDRPKSTSTMYDEGFITDTIEVTAKHIVYVRKVR